MFKNNSSQESHFDYTELFYSKTDQLGKISSGNSVFCRVGEFSLEEMLNKPHNIIRHPDMPKAVFKLLWGYLKNNKPIGAFVKNRSKTGKFYWVFALAMPIRDEYISVRIKPSGELLEIISSVYSLVRDKEIKEGMSTDASLELLQEKLKELGFATYDQFMSHAIFDQISLRIKILGQAFPAILQEAMEIKNKSSSIIGITQKILEAFKKSQFIPLNLELFSQKQEKQTQTISVVASQYQKTTTEISEKITKFQTMTSEVMTKITEMQFYTCLSNLLVEMRTFIVLDTSNRNLENEVNIINEVKNNYDTISKNYITSTIQIMNDFISICKELNSLGVGLEFIRLVGKIELARIEESSDAKTMIASLKNFQTILKEGLKEVLDINNFINQSCENILNEI